MKFVIQFIADRGAAQIYRWQYHNIIINILECLGLLICILKTYGWFITLMFLNIYFNLTK